MLRARRGMLSRPPLDGILDWRAHVDKAIGPLLTDPAHAPLIELGIAHEQQHQELLLTDIKHALFQNPLGPAMWAPAEPVVPGRPRALERRATHAYRPALPPARVVGELCSLPSWSSFQPVTKPAASVPCSTACAVSGSAPTCWSSTTAVGTARPPKRARTVRASCRTRTTSATAPRCTPATCTRAGTITRASCRWMPTASTMPRRSRDCSTPSTKGPTSSSARAGSPLRHRPPHRHPRPARALSRRLPAPQGPHPRRPPPVARPSLPASLPHPPRPDRSRARLRRGTLYAPASRRHPRRQPDHRRLVRPGNEAARRPASGGGVRRLRLV